MRKVMVAWLAPGMVLAKDAYHDDQLILPIGYQLTDKAIARLAHSSVPFVFIEEEQSAAEERPVEKEISYKEKIEKSSEFQNFSEDFQKYVRRFKSVISSALERNLPPNTEILIQDVTSLLKYTHENISLFDMLYYMHHSSKPASTHSIEVALICHELAAWLNMSHEDILTAAQCGLLHDIGKFTSTPDAMANHHVQGYMLLRKYDLNPHISNVALMHHERCDGSGAPLGITADKIDVFAKLVALADTYVSIISPQTHKTQVCPFEIIRTLETVGMQQFDPVHVSTFLSKMANTYKSCKVRLSDGRSGVISSINKFSLSRPVVQCGNNYVDLSQETSLKIECIL